MHSPANRTAEVGLAFLKLGVSSFGGPVAHLGYFREEFVRRRAWLNDRAYGEVVGLCQFLPGPASSQAAMALGLMRAGWGGALAAWIGFTLPSALLMMAFALALQSGAAVFNTATAVAVVHGLKLVAVPIVAQAVWSMAKTLCPDMQRILIAMLCASLLLFAPGSLAQIAAIVLGAGAGMILCRDTGAHPAAPLPLTLSRRAGVILLALFALLLLVLPALRMLSPEIALADAMYRSGALVFGGGHVVLPLLREAVVIPGWLSDETFLAGYGAAQAVPGPLFTFAAFVGWMAHPPGAAGGFGLSLLALVMIFLPGSLVLFGALPFWGLLRVNAKAQAALRGVNAAVVGILAAALYNPVAATAVITWIDAAIAAVGFALLAFRKTPPWIVVALTVAATLAARFYI
jgi:chromate transporter